MARPVTIILACFFSLVTGSILAVGLVGKPTVLRYAEKIKPYSIVFRNTARPRADRYGEPLIIFFGDSSVALPPWAIEGSPHIPALLEDRLRHTHPELGDVTVVEWAFDGARMFHYYCLLFEAARYSPDLVVIPINWRSLGPQLFDWKEHYSFPELSGLVPLSERDQLSGGDLMDSESIDAASQALYAAQWPLLYVTGLRTWARIKLGMEPEKEPLSELRDVLPSLQRLIRQVSDEELSKKYNTGIDPNNSQLKAVRAVTEAAARLNVRVLFYITPIHMGEIRRRGMDGTFGKPFTLVTDTASSSTSMCINLAGLLPEDAFIDQYEHYTPTGNRLVAFALAGPAAGMLRNDGSHQPARDSE
jgi:hypothetical protein